MKKWQIYYYKTDDEELDDVSDDFMNYGSALAEAKDVIDECPNRRAEIVELTTVANVDREYKVTVSKP